VENTASADNSSLAAARAVFVRSRIPPGGLFAGLDWRISPEPFPLGEKLAEEIESLGRVLLQFYRATNLLYRRSVEGKQPEWVARWLDLGKPPELIALQRAAAFKNDVPRVIRPDILLTENGFSITELDSVPGGVGLTAWLNKTYSESRIKNPESKILGGADGMVRGFESIFGDAKQVHIVVSEEAATYKPEMEWLAAQLGARFTVHDSQFNDFTEGSAVYRFFELFDLPNVANAKRIFELAAGKNIQLTPPPKPMFEEKMLLALLWKPEPAKLLAAGTGRRFSNAAEENRSLHLARGPCAVAAARSDPRIESHGLVPTQGDVTEGTRSDFESVRFL
jgi:hypothetical protein